MTWIPTTHAIDRFCQRVDAAMSADQADEYLRAVWPERCYPIRERTRSGEQRWKLTEYDSCELVTKRDAQHGTVFVVTALGPDEVVHEESDLLEQWELEEMLRLWSGIEVARRCVNTPGRDHQRKER